MLQATSTAPIAVELQIRFIDAVQRSEIGCCGFVGGNTAHAGSKGAQGTAIPGQAAKQASQGKRIARGEVKPVHPVSHLLRHPSDVGDDKRPAVADRFLNHHGGVLPPDRGHKDDVNGLHEAVDALAVVRAVEADVGAGGPELLQEGRLELRGLAAVVAENLETHVEDVIGGEGGGSVEQDIGALQAGDLAEETNAKRAGVGNVERRSRLVRRHQVLEDPHFGRRDPPRDISVGEELAGGDENVHQVEEALDVALAEEEVGAAELGKAALAPGRAGLVAEVVVFGGDHLAEMMADGEVLMQRQHDAAGRAHPLEVLEYFDTEVDVVVKMHHVRGEFDEQSLDFDAKTRVGVRKLEPVKRAGAVDVFVVAEGLAQHGAGSVGRCSAVTAQEPGLAVRALPQGLV